MRKVNFDAQISVKVSRAQRQFIDSYSESHGTSIGETVRLLINSGIRDLKTR